MLQPGFAARDRRIVLTGVENSAWTKAGFPANALIHVRPEPHGVDDERDFARIAPHLAAPAPIPAGLLAANLTLFENRDGNAALGKRQRRANPNDAAADNGRINRFRQFGIAFKRAQGKQHEAALSDEDESGNAIQPPPWMRHENRLRLPVPRHAGR